MVIQTKGELHEALCKVWEIMERDYPGTELVLDKRYATIRKVESIDLEEHPEVTPAIGEASVVRRYSDVACFASPAIVKLVNASENEELFNF